MRSGLDARAEPPLPRRGGGISNAANEITKFRGQAVGGLAGNFGRPRFLGEGRMAAASSPEEFRSLPRRRPRCHQFRFTYRVSWIPFPSHTARRPRPRPKVGARARHVIPHLHLCVCLRARGESANLSVARRKHSDAPPPRARRITHAVSRAPNGGSIADSDTYATVAR